MNIKFIIIFSLLSLVNVVFATFKSLVTIKGGKWAAVKTNLRKICTKILSRNCAKCQIPIFVKSGNKW